MVTGGIAAPNPTAVVGAGATVESNENSVAGVEPMVPNDVAITLGAPNPLPKLVEAAAGATAVPNENPGADIVSAGLLSVPKEKPEPAGAVGLPVDANVKPVLATGCGC